VTRAGRRFELLISELERLLARTDVTVTSPDHIMGRNSRTLREVDVSVRGQFGSVNMLVILECRDRSRGEDVTWIEQLVKKRDDVGAQRAIAVASSGRFSDAAQRVADANGILCRGTQPLKPEEFFDWLPLRSVRVEARNIEIKGVSIELQGDDRNGPSVGIPKEVAEALQRGRVDETFLRRKADQTAASLGDVWRSASRQALYEGIEANSAPVRRSITLSFPNPAERFQIQTDNGWEDITTMVVTGDLTIHGYDVPVSRFYSYVESDRSLTQSAEVEIVHDGTTLTLSFHRDSDTGNVEVIAHSDNDIRFDWKAQFQVDE
jgi:hypothetical protein